MLPWIFALALVCLVVERAAPGWRLPKVRTWPRRVVLVNLVQLGVVLLAGLTWERWLSSWSLLDLGSRLPPWAGGAVAYFIATFVFYWWHRVRHTSDWLWLHFHQVHHSPRRLEVITSFYKHPLEMVVNSLIGSALVYTILGLSPEAGAIYTFLTAAGEFFYHTNVKTPRWVGLVFQRPEMHRIHHEYGRHRSNYGDVVWWDMLFGTYENPATFDATCGFDPEKEEELGRMLAFKDVHKPVAVLCAALLAAFATTRADACTSFRTESPEGHVLMAKDYDWALEGGYVVALPKGQRRTALPVATPWSWTSRYGSLAFTQLGLGLTISGMNEQGLAVETLVNATGRLSPMPFRGDEERALPSLQWVQYQLDTADSVRAVLSSLESIGIVQLLVPVHFLVCDRSGACAVVETDAEGHAVATHVEQSDGSKARAVVLANRDWALDAKDAKIARSWLPSLSLESSSVRRFAAATERLASRAGKGLQVRDAFELLEDVRMPMINRWQIVWDLTDGKAYWINRDGKRGDEAFASFDLRDLPAACGGDRILAAALDDGAAAAPRLELTDRSAVTSGLETLLDRTLSLVRLRSTGALPDQIRAAARAVGRDAACQ